jgi:hypothetical protein
VLPPPAVVQAGAVNWVPLLTAIVVSTKSFVFVVVTLGWLPLVVWSATAPLSVEPELSTMPVSVPGFPLNS